MMNKFTHIAFALFLSIITVNAQDKKLDKAHESFERFEFNNAIQQYERLIANGTTSPEILRNLGDANYYNANYEDAAKWYAQLANSSTDALGIEHMYRYASTLRAIKEYEASNVLFKKLNLLQASDNISNSGDFLDDIKERFGSYTVENVAINSPESDFAPSFRLDGIVFSTGRDTSGISKTMHNWNKKRFLNLYTASLKEDGGLEKTMRFSDKLNTKLHESSTAFTKDGNTVYFTRNKEKGRSFGRDKKGVSRLKLYKAVFENGKWKNVKALPFNQEGYSVAHPTLNKAEDKLYFASDIPGTVGQSDIYVVDILPDGTYSTPKNLGKKLNTIGRETFPYITDDDVLYFASDVHPGFGGLDVFAVDLNDLENSKIVNLGEPVNSTSDDFSFILNNESKRGYFASNRAEGKGSDDIYAFTEVKPMDTRCFSNLSGLVKNKITDEIMPNSTVILLDDKGQKIEEATTDAKGLFAMKNNCASGSFVFVASKENYETGRASISQKEGEDVSDIVLLLSNMDKGAPIGTDLAKYLNIEPIYFDFNKWNIRADAAVSIQKIISYLEKYPEAKVRIGSHTDSRASRAYNTRLSDKRANSTMEYLIKSGIAPTRLSALGLGETMLVNACSDNVSCNEAQHQENRRSEFILIE